MQGSFIETRVKGDEIDDRIRVGYVVLSLLRVGRGVELRMYLTTFRRYIEMAHSNFEYYFVESKFRSDSSFTYFYRNVLFRIIIFSDFATAIYVYFKIYILNWCSSRLWTSTRWSSLARHVEAGRPRRSLE